MMCLCIEMCPWLAVRRSAELEMRKQVGRSGWWSMLQRSLRKTFPGVSVLVYGEQRQMEFMKQRGLLECLRKRSWDSPLLPISFVNQSWHSVHGPPPPAPCDSLSTAVLCYSAMVPFFLPRLFTCLFPPLLIPSPIYHKKALCILEFFDTTDLNIKYKET